MFLKKYISNFPRLFNYLLLVFLFVLLGALWINYNHFSYEVYERHALPIPYPKLEGVYLPKNLKQGEYLAKLGNCISCHTDNTEKAMAFSGGLMINTPFGKIPSTNITPDPKTGIGLWSLDEFKNAMKHGISPSGKNYYPAFPYLYFSNLTESDLSDLYDYFMAIPPVVNNNKTPEFPLNLWGARSFVSLWNLFGFPRKPELLGAKNSVQNKIGAYIVNGLGHCGMCHTTSNLFGLPKNQMYLSGAFIGGFWAPNINQLGLNGVNDQEVMNVFKNETLMSNAGPLAGPMADVTVNSLKYLMPADAQAIVSYLKQLESKPLLSISPVLPESIAPSFERGQAVYMQVCAACHQAGMASAPRIGQAETWFNRLNNASLDLFYQRTLNGFNNMPKMGGCVYCTKNDIVSAVDFLLYQSLTSSQIQQLKPSKP